MIHAQQRREAATGAPFVPEPRNQAPATGAEQPTGPDAPVAAAAHRVPGQQGRRPDAYDLYAEIFAIRAESHPA